MTFFEDEADADLIEDLLEKAELNQVTIYVSFASFAEILYISIREQGLEIDSERQRQLETLPIIRVESNPQQTEIAGKWKAKHRISFADAFIAALAKEYQATLVHKDPEFQSLKNELPMVILEYK